MSHEIILLKVCLRYRGGQISAIAMLRALVHSMVNPLFYHRVA